MEGETGELERPPDICEDYSHVIECERCGGRIGVENQYALDKVRDVLEGANGCDDPRGHDIIQIQP